jgi:PhnB protein
MSQSVSPVPNGNPAVSPYLLIRGASDAIAFYAKVFGATEHFRLTAPDGRIGHAEIEIAGSRLMIADEHPEMDFLGPQSRGGTTVTLHVYLPDVDSVFALALASGAEELRPLCNQFYGDRSGAVTDPWGHVWSLASRIEAITNEEIQNRFNELYAD